MASKMSRPGECTNKYISPPFDLFYHALDILHHSGRGDLDSKVIVLDNVGDVDLRLGVVAQPHLRCLARQPELVQGVWQAGQVGDFLRARGERCC